MVLQRLVCGSLPRFQRKVASRLFLSFLTDRPIKWSVLLQFLRSALTAFSNRSGPSFFVVDRCRVGREPGSVFRSIIQLHLMGDLAA